MNHRIALILAFTTAFCPAFAAPDALNKFTKKLSEADSIKASFSVNMIGQGADNYTLTLAKPNKARIDTPKRTFVADGDTITIYVKASKKYFTRPQNGKELAGLFKEDALKPWLTFFNDKALNNYSSSAGSVVKRKGMDLQQVNLVLDAAKGKVLSLFIDKKDDLAKQAILIPDPKKKDDQRIIDVLSVDLGTKPKDEAFAFKAPANSQLINEADLVEAEWIYNYQDALALAQETNRMVLVDFFATWCGPCKMLEANVFSTMEFKNLAEKFVFCQIDVDQQKDLAAQFKIEAMPTTVIVDNQGNELGRFLGYMPVAEYLQAVKKISGLL